MKVKDMIAYLKTQDSEREVVIHDWAGEKGSRFYGIEPACTPLANTTNLLVFRGDGLYKPDYLEV